MIDSHTHLHLCEPPDAELVAAAVEAGVNRIVTVGTDGESCRAALAAAERFPEVFAAIGRHPNSATGFDDADLAELETLAAHPRCVAVGETGLDYYRDGAPAADQRRAFTAQIELARPSRQAVGHPHARRRRRHARGPHRVGGRAQGHPALLLDGRARAASAWRTPTGGSPSPATSPSPKPSPCARPCSGFPTRGCSSRPTPPISRPRSCAASPISPRTSFTPPRRWPCERRVAYPELEAALQDSAAEVFGW